MIAPNQVEFFSREGELLGDKRLLEQQIFQITEVPIAALRGAAMSDFSVEERLQWAASRKTKIREDKAYCLLGIFDVFMPLIYGKGDNAYTRLQSELNKFSGVRSWAKSSEYKAKDNVLRSLWYPRMQERIDQIQQAYGDTYKWIFEADVKPDIRSLGFPFRPPGTGHSIGLAVENYHTSDDFSTWLRTKNPENGIYWINGKAGSGKSTLMRYLDININPNDHMEPWAGGLDVLKARYFFWNPAESSLQKSPVGLMRSLLFQLLEQSPAYIGSCVPLEKWRIAQRDDASLEWTKAELQETMKKYLNSTYRTSRMLLIIDGLDEADGSNEDIDWLLTFLEEISKHCHVKICISSRPWLVFQEAFHGCARLRLEELTYADIPSFVLENMSSGLILLVGSRRLADSIVDKAEGVFLWAKLVVRELLQNLRDGEGVTELLRVLDEIPADLDDHFRRMIDSVPAAYRPEASIIFQIALHHEEYIDIGHSLRLLDLSFLDAAGADFALVRQPQALDFLDREAILFRLDSTLRRLNSRCLGMLECFYYPGETAGTVSVPENSYEPPLNGQVEENLEEAVFLPMIQAVAVKRQHKLFPFDFRVDFMHRSLRDFMVSDGLQRLRQNSNVDFDSRDFLRNARIVQARQIQEAGICTPLATGLCSYVISAIGLPDYRASAVSAKLAESICETVEGIPEGNGSESFWHLSVSLSMWQTECSSFLTVAIDFGLEAYIQQELRRETILGKRGRPILDYILRPRFVEPPPSRQIGRQSPSIDLVQYVLDHGGDPNEQWDGSSVWALFLCFIATFVKKVGPTETHKQDYFLALVTLIQHGASRMISKPWLSVEAYFDMVHEPWPTIPGDTAEERFRRRWGVVSNAMAGGSDNQLCHVRDLVECFVHPNVFDSQQVKHLQLLLDNTRRGSEPVPTISVSSQQE